MALLAESSPHMIGHQNGHHALLRVLAFFGFIWVAMTNNHSNPTEFRIGVLLPVFEKSEPYDFFPMEYSAFSGFVQAVDELNNRTDGVADELAEGYYFNFSFWDTNGDSGSAFLSTYQLLEEGFDGRGVHAVVGPFFDEPTMNSQLLLYQNSVPQVNFGAGNDELSDTAQYPFLTRLSPTDSTQAAAALAVVAGHFGWGHAVVIGDTSAYGRGASEAVHHASEYGGALTITDHMFVLDLDSIDLILEKLEDLGTRVVLLYCEYAAALATLRAAQGRGLLGPASSYVWLLSSEPARQLARLGAELGAASLRGAFALGGVSSPGAGRPEHAAFAERFRRRPSTLGDCAAQAAAAAADCSCSGAVDAAGHPLYVRDPDGDAGAAPAVCTGFAYGPGAAPSLEAAAYFDAMYTLAHALHGASGGQEARRRLGAAAATLLSGEELMAAMTNVSFEGASGTISFAENGDRSIDTVRIELLNHDGETAWSIGAWTNATGFVLEEGVTVIYPTLNNTFPEDQTSENTCLDGEVLPAGSVNCILCPPGTFSWVAGEEKCHDCPIGANCYGGSHVTAREGYWRFAGTPGTCGRADGATTYEDCFFQECNAEGACEGDALLSQSASLQVGSALLTVDENLAWLNDECYDPARPSGAGNASGCAVYAEGYVLALLNSPDAAGRGTLRLAAPFADDLFGLGSLLLVDLYLVGAEGCGAGYQGNLCAQCAVGYGHNGWGASCGECPASLALSIFLLGVACTIVLVVGAVIIYLQMYKDVGTNERLSVMARIFTSYVQIVAVFATLDLEWPSGLAGGISQPRIITDPGDGLISFGCLFGGRAPTSTAYIRFLLFMAAPVALVVLVTVVWTLRYLAHMRQLRRRPFEFHGLKAIESGLIEAEAVRGVLEARGLRSDPLRVYDVVKILRMDQHPARVADFQFAWERAYAAIVRENWTLSLTVLLHLLHPTVAKEAFRVFNCRELAPGDYYLAEDLDVACYTTAHWLWVFLGGLPAVVFYTIGIPALLLNSLSKVQGEIHDKHVRLKYGFLLSGFKDEYFFWEVWVMMRKVLAIFVVVIMAPVGAITQAVSALAVMGFSLVLHHKYLPFTDPEFVRLESAALYAILFTLLVGCLFFADEFTNPHALAFLIAICIVANVAFVAHFVRIGFSNFRHQVIQDTVRVIDGLGEMRRRAFLHGRLFRNDQDRQRQRAIKYLFEFRVDLMELQNKYLDAAVRNEELKVGARANELEKQSLELRIAKALRRLRETVDQFSSDGSLPGEHPAMQHAQALLKTNVFIGDSRRKHVEMWRRRASLCRQQLSTFQLLKRPETAQQVTDLYNLSRRQYGHAQQPRSPTHSRGHNPRKAGGVGQKFRNAARMVLESVRGGSVHQNSSRARETSVFFKEGSVPEPTVSEPRRGEEGGRRRSIMPAFMRFSGRSDMVSSPRGNARRNSSRTNWSGGGSHPPSPSNVQLAGMLALQDRYLQENAQRKQQQQKRRLSLGQQAAALYPILHSAERKEHVSELFGSSSRDDEELKDEGHERHQQNPSLAIKVKKDQDTNERRRSVSSVSLQLLGDKQPFKKSSFKQSFKWLQQAPEDQTQGSPPQKHMSSKSKDLKRASSVESMVSAATSLTETGPVLGRGGGRRSRKSGSRQSEKAEEDEHTSSDDPDSSDPLVTNLTKIEDEKSLRQVRSFRRPMARSKMRTPTKDGTNSPFIQSSHPSRGSSIVHKLDRSTNSIPRTASPQPKRPPAAAAAAAAPGAAPPLRVSGKHPAFGGPAPAAQRRPPSRPPSRGSSRTRGTSLQPPAGRSSSQVSQSSNKHNASMPSIRISMKHSASQPKPNQEELATKRNSEETR